MAKSSEESPKLLQALVTSVLTLRAEVNHLKCVVNELKNELHSKKLNDGKMENDCNNIEFKSDDELWDILKTSAGIFKIKQNYLNFLKINSI